MVLPFSSCTNSHKITAWLLLLTFAWQLPIIFRIEQKKQPMRSFLPLQQLIIAAALLNRPQRLTLPCLYLHCLFMKACMASYISACCFPKQRC
jgi:hypothetical protein